METVQGVSPTIQLENTYAVNGGISLMSADDNTQTGGSIYNPDGSYFSGYQILWTITRIPQADNTYSYHGGVTNQKWFLEEAASPFYGATVEQIATDAFKEGNLNTYFSDWLVRTTSEQKNTFIFTMATANCVKF